MKSSKFCTMGLWLYVVSVVCVAAQAQTPRSGRSEEAASSVSTPGEPETTGLSSPVKAGPTAVVPRLMKFSGVLHDVSGKPLTGAVDVTFSLYSTEVGGAPLWFETQSVQADELGRYTALLGAIHTEGLPVDLFTSGEVRWLGIQIGMEPEQQPRVLLVSVPYALKAGDAETLGGKPASAYQLSDSQSTSTSATGTTAIGKTTAGSSAKNPMAHTANTSALTACAGLTSDGTAVASSIAMFTTACNIESSGIYQVSGNVGVGTSSPAAKLHVANGDIRLVNGGSYPVIFDQSTGSIFTITNGVGKKLAFNYNGYLGLGTTAPAAMLHVLNGNMRLQRTGSYAAVLDQSSGSIFTITNGVGKQLAFDYNGNLTTPGSISSASGYLVGGGFGPNTSSVIADYSMNVDALGGNNGGAAPGLIFGAPSSGEGIASRRQAGANQFGLDFYTAYANRVSITNGGYVGVGTTGPSHNLEVQGAAATLGGFLNTGAGTDHTSLVDFQNGDGNLWRVGVGGSGNGLGFTAGQFYIEESGSGEAFRIDTSHNTWIDGGIIYACYCGQVSISDNGYVSGSYTLTVNSVNGGNGKAISSGWDTFSSRRFKTNIQTLQGGLNKVEQLRGVTYNDKSDGKPEVGVIAEEVAQVLPQIVGYNKDGQVEGVDYARLTAVLIQAVKEQQKEIRIQRATIRKQSAQIARLASQVENIQTSLKTSSNNPLHREASERIPKRQSTAHGASRTGK